MICSDSDFLRNFIKNNPFLKDNPEYVKSCVLYQQEGDYGIFGKRIKNAYNKFIVNGNWKEDELENALSVLIYEKKIISYKTLEEIKKYIDIGLYDDLLQKKSDMIEFEKIDWSDFN